MNFPQNVNQPTVCILGAGTCPSHQFSPRCWGGVLECSDIYAVGSVVSPTSSSKGMFMSLHRHPCALKLPVVKKECLSTDKTVALMILIA